MAINQNHPFEDLDGVKCAVVEKNVSPTRLSFLKELLELNGYTVISVASAPAKQVAGEESATETPASFTVGVTDVMFNATNAVFGRLLRTAKGQVVTLEYWQQKSSIADGAKPYFSTKN